jgi:quinol monooxygenase YgiN
MRGITISYKYAGPEEAWLAAVDDFVMALDDDPEVTGKFNYQVAVADDQVTRIHWGRWDSEATLETVRSRDYFKQFARRILDLAGGQPQNVGADLLARTKGW